MSSINIIRLINGLLVLVGILFFRPLVYFVAIMMIFAGLTGFCLLEKIFAKFGVKATCSLK